MAIRCTGEAKGETVSMEPEGDIGISARAAQEGRVFFLHSQVSRASLRGQSRKAVAIICRMEGSHANGAKAYASLTFIALVLVIRLDAGMMLRRPKREGLVTYMHTAPKVLLLPRRIPMPSLSDVFRGERCLLI